MKTVVAYGNGFGADKLVNLGGNPHSVLLFGSAPVQPIVDILNECADAGLKTYAPYTMDPRPYDFDNVETEPEYQYKLQKLYSIQSQLEMVHLRLGYRALLLGIPLAAVVEPGTAGCDPQAAHRGLGRHWAPFLVDDVPADVEQPLFSRITQVGMLGGERCIEAL